MSERTKAINWFSFMDLENQFYKTIEANSVIEGDKTRHPHTLTGREIIKIYKYHKNKEDV